MSYQIPTSSEVQPIVALGPMPMALPEQWTVEKANDMAHYLEVVDCLTQTPWANAYTVITYDVTGLPEGQTGKLLRFDTPNIVLLNSAIVFIRQLLPTEDKLFAKANN